VSLLVHFIDLFWLYVNKELRIYPAASS